MAQDPADFGDENEFSRALLQNPKNKFVNAPKPKGRDTRVLAPAKSGLGRNFTNIQEANAELNRLQAFDPERLPDKLSRALRKREAWADPVDSGYAIDVENKKARSMGFSSVVEYVDAIRKGINEYKEGLSKQQRPRQAIISEGTNKAYPSQGKMSRLMEEDLKKRSGAK